MCHSNYWSITFEGNFLCQADIFGHCSFECKVCKYYDSDLAKKLRFEIKILNKLRNPKEVDNK